MFPLCFQSTVVVDFPSGVAELDSDMADITQSLPTQSMLGGEEEGDELGMDTDTMGGKRGGLIPAEHDGVPASSHIASTLGINPHTLQARELPTPRLAGRKSHQTTATIITVFPCCVTDNEGLSVC